MSDIESSNNRIDQQAIVPEALGGGRFDKIAAVLFSAFSRAELSRWILAGALTADGEQLPGKTRLRGGELLQLSAHRPLREAWQEPQALPLDILYEDDELLIINKPAGLVVHPGAGNPAGTLLNGLLHYRPGLTHLPRAGVVHRLDKDTSGVMVVAGSAAAHRQLTRMIAQRKVHRDYLGICEGRMVAGQDVDKPIGRHPQVRTRQAVRDDGKPASTEFRVRQRYRTHTLVHARLGTGRTHQIRVHLQSIGYPLVGDRRYGARGRLPTGADATLISCLQQFKRHALHAEQLTFMHPLAQTECVFRAPLPEDMHQLSVALGKDAEAAGHGEHGKHGE